MNEAYVTFETAKLLKEKGFDWETICDYDEAGRRYDYTLRGFIEPTDVTFPCSTQQMACKWLREEYKIFISIGIGTDIDGRFGYVPSIYLLLSTSSCNDGRFVPSVDADPVCDFTPQTYEEAVEAALKYVLTELI